MPGTYWNGFNAKFDTVPDYLTPEFTLRWVVSRFAIQAEQMYTYVFGNSVIGKDVTYMELVLRSISDRFDLVFTNYVTLEYPRSVSEATFYDMKNGFGSGSSPGALLGTTLSGPFFFVPILTFSVIIFNLMYGITRKITFPEICAYSFLLKPIHANFSEYLTIISPTLLLVAVVLFCALLKPKPDRSGRWNRLGAGQ